MKTMHGWMKAGTVAAVMIAAAAAGAQTTAEDAAKAADARAQVAAKQADVQAQIAEQMAKQQAQLGPMRARMAEQMAKVQAQMGPMRAQMAREMAVGQQARMAKIQAQVAAQMGPMQAEMEARMLPMEAKLEVGMAPMEAAMIARSAAMQAQMAARSVSLPAGRYHLSIQDGMVSVGDPQVKDDLFEGTEKFAKGASDVTSVNLGPDMLGMVSGKHGGDMAHKLNFMVVRTYEYPRTGMYNPADLEVYRQKLRDGKWNCFIHTTESRTGESTDICNRPLPNGEGNEMVIMTVEPKELTFIHMSGKGSLADLGKMGRMGGMGGMSIPDPPDPPEPAEPAPPAHPHP
jgi:hypothetical protein